MEKKKRIRKDMEACLMGMKQRCYNENHKNYKYYGAKGIRICDEWLDLCNFQKWGYANGWEKGLSIDRINPAGHYEPSNCRWISIAENSARTKRGPGFKFKDVPLNVYGNIRVSSNLSLEDAAVFLGVSARMIRYYELGEKIPSKAVKKLYNILEKSEISSLHPCELIAI